MTAVRLPPELAEIVGAWENLPAPVRHGILAMVRSAVDVSG